jgi:hypothetical protein
MNGDILLILLSLGRPGTGVVQEALSAGRLPMTRKTAEPAADTVR